MHSFYYKILVADKYAADAYIYSSQHNVEFGQIVEIEYGKHKHYGVCIELLEDLKQDIKFEIKQISEIFDYKISNEQLNFAKFCADYNLVSIGSILEMMLPSILKKQLLPILYEVDNCIYSLDILLENGMKRSEIIKMNAWKNGSDSYNNEKSNNEKYN